MMTPDHSDGVGGTALAGVAEVIEDRPLPFAMKKIFASAPYVAKLRQDGGYIRHEPTVRTSMTRHTVKSASSPAEGVMTIEAAIEPQIAPPLTVVSTRMPRVLMIEDNSGDVELLTIAFEMSGILAVITSADDGDMGIVILRNMVIHGEPPDLVVLDLNLPRRSGFDVLTEIAELPSSPRFPVVVWTSSSALKDRGRCLALGCTAFYTKPERISEYMALAKSLRLHFTGDRP